MAIFACSFVSNKSTKLVNNDFSNFSHRNKIMWIISNDIIKKTKSCLLCFRSGFKSLFNKVSLKFEFQIEDSNRCVTNIRFGSQTKHFLLSGSCPVTGLFPCQTGLFINVKVSQRLRIYMPTFHIVFSFPRWQKTQILCICFVFIWLIKIRHLFCVLWAYDR